MVVATGEVRFPRFLRRDAGAEVERLYRRHSAEVLRYSLLVLRSRSDAEDVTQAVFIPALGPLREQLEGALSCEKFARLLDDPDARARVRAHARICADCATLERQARGRKSALKRIASALGLPWWGAKVAAVALTTATVAG